jgi:hypothetical protein
VSTTIEIKASLPRHNHKHPQSTEPKYTIGKVAPEQAIRGTALSSGSWTRAVDVRKTCFVTMAYPFPRQGNSPPQTSAYDDYRPTSRHDLHIPSYNNPNSASSPAAPPRIASPQPPTNPFNPYSQTTFNPGGDSPYKDYSHTGSQSYFDPNRSEQTFGGSTPYQEPYPKLNEAAPYFDGGGGYNNAPTPPPPRQRTLFSRLFNGEQRFAYFCWTISIIQIGVFIGELVHNAMAMKTPIEIQPTFNPLIGPSSYVPSLLKGGG